MIYVVLFVVGMLAYLFYRLVLGCVFTVSPDQRAVKTSFGAVQRLSADAEPIQSDALSDEERERYRYPQVRVIPPGGPYFRLPWEEVHKISVATQSVDIAWDPTKNQSTIEAVTKDNLTTGVNGQIRYRISENNLYPYLFGVAQPLEHVMGYFISVLRERIANFVDPKTEAATNAATDDSATAAAVDPEALIDADAAEIAEGVSINDLRKNLPTLNQYMEQQCRGTTARYGIELDAALITEIDPPPEVDRALSAINSTRNQVAADISTAKADAEQQITMSARAVEIATNNAQAEVAPLEELARTLAAIKSVGGSRNLKAYLRNARLPLRALTRRVIQTQPSNDTGE